MGVQPQWATGRAIGPTPQFVTTLMGSDFGDMPTVGCWVGCGGV